MTGGRPPAPTTDRDIFILTAFRRANGQLVEARDALLACLTHLDIEGLARRGQSKDELVTGRLAARRRLLQVLSGE